MDTQSAPGNAERLPPLHPGFTLVSVLVLGLAALAAPAWLAHANPTGLEVVDGVVVHAADAPGAKLRGTGYTGGMLAVAGVEPGSDRTQQFVVGLLFFCVEEGHDAELTGLSAVLRPGTPEVPSSGVVRRVDPDQAGVAAMGSAWGDPAQALDDVGTWHELPGGELPGVEVTGVCPAEGSDAVQRTGEEVMALLQVGQEGVAVDRFELEALVDGKPHRLLVEADVAVCGTEVRGFDEDIRCDEG